MRRPSPLPEPPVRPGPPVGAGHSVGTGQPVAPSADEIPDAAPDDGATDRGGQPPGDDAGDRATAPVIPLTAPLSLPGMGDVSGDRREPEIDEPVGLREVWKAARARRKALRAEVRRFTVRQRRRRAVWVGAAASLLVLALGTLGAAYSPLFAVETITVVGTEQLPAAEVEAALSDQLGSPMPLVDESAVKAALVAFPLVESYTLEARPPHELVVRIVERTPIGVIETRAGYTLVDAAGVALSTSAAPPSGAPVLSITGGVGSDAFAAVGQVMRSLPEEIALQVTAVAASTPDDVTLTLGGTNTEVVWGSAEDSAMKAVVLQRAMVSRPPADVFSYDVSSPSAIVIR